MQVATTIPSARQAVEQARAEGRRIGLVPTMGALHRGHVALMEECRRLADFTAVSIFVNPAQFGPGEDYDRYPRMLEDDLRACEAAGVDLVFKPTVAEMYPRGVEAATFVEVPGLSHVFEGEIRPTHFRGVATVVLALFEIIRPDVAIFGQKDYQQQALLRRMAADLHLPVEVVTHPTVREADNLAISSRNIYLDPAQRRGSLALSQALEAACEAVARGEADANRVRQILRSRIESEQAAILDYAEVVDAETLETLDRIEPGRPAVALLAARFGQTRLIDNARLTE
ncbi:pantoate--beta-alanine ligase [Planctomyces sp. SH-PL62]|uniref:pantoate--beta-alanine ligase n=1 Tax=Planctomyces sp. SH-PL62 TaxID=1636152 RepID=UPI00078B33A4|nr:pantoate--beta-alanine ligase [Planctomyces sp. SH-PL62]AMV39041.1 Pantothenate synthetase [Planctomyces sp. SH-PL62]